jgi:hypothetical protein
MALNASGPISLGGANAGESVNLELNKAATATISMNDADLRTLANVASGVITLPTDFYGKSSAPAFTRWYLSLGGPNASFRGLDLSSTTYTNDPTDTGFYVGASVALPVTGQTPWRSRAFMMKFNTTSQTLAWIQRAPVFQTNVSSAISNSNASLAAVGSSGLYYRGDSGMSSSVSQYFFTPVDTSTGAYISPLQIITPSGSIFGGAFKTHNKADCYFARPGSTGTANTGFVNRLIPGTFTNYPFCIRSSGFASQFNPISIDATNRIALFSKSASSSSSGSANVYQLHELDADFNVISGFNFSGDLAGLTRNNTEQVNLAVAHNKDIVGNQNIFIMWGLFTPAQGITGIRVACVDFATKTITWQRNMTSSFSTLTYSPATSQQSGADLGIIATADGGCVFTWAAVSTSTVPASSRGYLTKLSASGAHQFTQRVIVAGMDFEPGRTPIVATKGSEFVISVVHGSSGGGAGTNKGFFLNLSADPSISNLMPATSIGNGITVQIVAATDVTVSSVSPTIGLTTESPAYISRQAIGGNIPIVGTWAGTISQGTSLTTPTIVGGTI